MLIISLAMLTTRSSLYAINKQLCTCTVCKKGGLKGGILITLQRTINEIWNSTAIRTICVLEYVSHKMEKLCITMGILARGGSTDRTSTGNYSSMGTPTWNSSMVETPTGNSSTVADMNGGILAQWGGGINREF